MVADGGGGLLRATTTVEVGRCVVFPRLVAVPELPRPAMLAEALLPCGYLVLVEALTAHGPSAGLAKHTLIGGLAAAAGVGVSAAAVRLPLIESSWLAAAGCAALAVGYVVAVSGPAARRQRTESALGKGDEPWSST